jgi:hypothetical protein
LKYLEGLSLVPFPFLFHLLLEVLALLDLKLLLLVQQVGGACICLSLFIIVVFLGLG